MNLFFVLDVIDFDHNKINYSQLCSFHKDINQTNSINEDNTWCDVKLARTNLIYRIWWIVYRLTPNELMRWLIKNHLQNISFDLEMLVKFKIKGWYRKQIGKYRQNVNGDRV